MYLPLMSEFNIKNVGKRRIHCQKCKLTANCHDFIEMYCLQKPLNVTGIRHCWTKLNGKCLKQIWRLSCIFFKLRQVEKNNKHLWIFTSMSRKILRIPFSDRLPSSEEWEVILCSWLWQAVTSHSFPAKIYVVPLLKSPFSALCLLL